jgi:hypothetical protein
MLNVGQCLHHLGSPGSALTTWRYTVVRRARAGTVTNEKPESLNLPTVNRQVQGWCVSVWLKVNSSRFLLSLMVRYSDRSFTSHSFPLSL